MGIKVNTLIDFFWALISSIESLLKPYPSLFNNRYYIFFGCLGIIILWFISKLLKTRCPKCKSAKIKLVDWISIGELQTFNRTEKVIEQHKDNENKVIGTSEKFVTQTYTSQKYRASYHCKACSHKWKVDHTRTNIAGSSASNKPPSDVSFADLLKITIFLAVASVCVILYKNVQSENKQSEKKQSQSQSIEQIKEEKEQKEKIKKSQEEKIKKIKLLKIETILKEMSEEELDGIATSVIKNITNLHSSCKFTNIVAKEIKIIDDNVNFILYIGISYGKAEESSYYILEWKINEITHISISITPEKGKTSLKLTKDIQEEINRLFEKNYYNKIKELLAKAEIQTKQISQKDPTKKILQNDQDPWEQKAINALKNMPESTKKELGSTIIEKIKKLHNSAKFYAIKSIKAQDNSKIITCNIEIEFEYGISEKKTTFYTLEWKFDNLGHKSASITSKEGFLKVNQSIQNEINTLYKEYYEKLKNTVVKGSW